MDHSKSLTYHGGFYSDEELAAIGFKAFGDNLQISRRASIYRPEVISIGSNVRIDDFSLLSGGKGINIGSYVHIGAYAALFGGAGITMEDFSGISPRATVLSESDDIRGKSLTGPTVPLRYKPTFISKPVIFRRHSGMGVNSTILPGVEMGEGAVLGAHSLATKNCEPWTICFGTPAKRSLRRRRNVLELEQKFMADVATERDKCRG